MFVPSPSAALWRVPMGQRRIGATHEEIKLYVGGVETAGREATGRLCREPKSKTELVELVRDGDKDRAGRAGKR